MKKIIPILTLTIATLFLGGCSYRIIQTHDTTVQPAESAQKNVAQNDDWITYNDTYSGMSFKYPPEFGDPKREILFTSETIRFTNYNNFEVGTALQGQNTKRLIESLPSSAGITKESLVIDGYKVTKYSTTTEATQIVNLYFETSDKTIGYTLQKNADYGEEFSKRFISNIKVSAIAPNPSRASEVNGIISSTPDNDFSVYKAVPLGDYRLTSENYTFGSGPNVVISGTVVGVKNSNDSSGYPELLISDGKNYIIAFTNSLTRKIYETTFTNLKIGASVRIYGHSVQGHDYGSTADSVSVMYNLSPKLQGVPPLFIFIDGMTVVKQ